MRKYRIMNYTAPKTKMQYTKLREDAGSAVNAIHEYCQDMAVLATTDELRYAKYDEIRQESNKLLAIIDALIEASCGEVEPTDMILAKSAKRDVTEIVKECELAKSIIEKCSDEPTLMMQYAKSALSSVKSIALDAEETLTDLFGKENEQ